LFYSFKNSSIALCIRERLHAGTAYTVYAVPVGVLIYDASSVIDSRTEESLSMARVFACFSTGWPGSHGRYLLQGAHVRVRLA